MVFIRGEKPIQDFKFKTLKSPEFKEGCKLGPYNHDNGLEFDEFDTPIRSVNGSYKMHKKEDDLIFVNEASYNYYKKQSRLNDNIKIYDVTDMEVLGMFLSTRKAKKTDDEYRDFDRAKDDEMSNEPITKNKIVSMTITGNEVLIDDNDSIQDIIRKNTLRDETIDLITLALENHISEYHIGKLLETNDIRKAKVMLKGFIMSRLQEAQDSECIFAMKERMGYMTEDEQYAVDNLISEKVSEKSS